MNGNWNFIGVVFGPFSAVAACVLLLLALQEQKWREHLEVVAFVKEVGGEYDVASSNDQTDQLMAWWDPPRIVEIRVGNRLRMREGRPSTAAPIAGSLLNDDRLRLLTRARHLERLDISYSSISDAGAPLLCDLESLREVYLDGTFITDDSVPILAKMKRLQVIGIYDTSITADGAERLQESLPRADVLTERYQARSRP